MGQSRHFGRRQTTSGLPPGTDIVRPTRHVRKVPTGDIARALLWTIFWVKTWRSRASVKVNTTFLVGERHGRLATPCLRT